MDHRSSERNVESGRDQAPTRRPWIKKLIGLSIPAVLVTLGALEAFFRAVVPASEQPFAYFDRAHQILRYDTRANTEGTYTIGPWAQQRGRWRINNFGWNSETDYHPETRFLPVLAVIGDSYVEGFQVDVERTMTSVLRRSLVGQAEVYGFGTSGAPMSQYLQISRYVRTVFDPDVLVFLVIDNDFTESLADLVPKRHFLQVLRTNEGFVERIPVPYTPSATRRTLSMSALARYLALNLHAEKTLERLWSPSDAREESIAAWDESIRGKVGEATAYLVQQIRKENPRPEVIFMVDAPRRDIYVGRENQSPTEWLRRLVKTSATDNECRFLDLTDAFGRRFRDEGTRFETTLDYHWNEAGHETAAKALEEFLGEGGILSELGGRE